MLLKHLYLTQQYLKIIAVFKFSLNIHPHIHPHIDTWTRTQRNTKFRVTTLALPPKFYLVLQFMLTLFCSLIFCCKYFYSNLTYACTRRRTYLHSVTTILFYSNVFACFKSLIEILKFDLNMNVHIYTYIHTDEHVCKYIYKSYIRQLRHQNFALCYCFCLIKFNLI